MYCIIILSTNHFNSIAQTFIHHHRRHYSLSLILCFMFRRNFTFDIGNNVNKLLRVSYTNCLFPEHYMAIFPRYSFRERNKKKEKILLVNDGDIKKLIFFPASLFNQPNMPSSLFKQRSKMFKMAFGWFLQINNYCNKIWTFF